MRHTEVLGNWPQTSIGNHLEHHGLADRLDFVQPPNKDQVG